jgi:ankyrin repeat protein
MTSRSLVLVLSTLLFLPAAASAQNSKQELNDQFFEAVRKGDSASVAALLDKGADVNAKFRYGTTALFKAAERGHLEVVKILLARGADLSVKDTFYHATAMTWALQNDHTDVVNALLDKDPSSVDEVLMTGASEGKPALVKIALGKGGLSKETLTRALAIAMSDKDTAEAADVLKKAGAVPPPEIKAEILQSYVGKYKSESGMEITMTYANNILTGLVTGQRQPYALYAIDDVTFTPLFADDVVVKFKVDGGKVAGMTLTQGKTVTELARVN